MIWVFLYEGLDLFDKENVFTEYVIVVNNGIMITQTMGVN